MTRIIKLIAGACLVLSLFLPLSTCSRPAVQHEHVQSGEILYKNYVVSYGETEIVPYLAALPFVLPFLLALPGLRKSGAPVLADVASILCAVLVLALVYVHVSLAKLAAGGYLAAIMALACLVVAMTDVVAAIRARRGRQA